MALKYRTESDSLGSRKVPENVLWGIQTLRAVENFQITGLNVDDEFIRSIAIVKKAATLANLAIKELHPRIGTAIIKALDEIVAGKHFDQFITDPIQGGATTSINMNMNEVVANRALEIIGYTHGDYEVIHPNDHVNKAQSTNDVIPTAIRLTAYTLFAKLLDNFNYLDKALSRKAREFKGVIKLGRTHLQDAVPTTLGNEFAAYAALVRQDISRLKSARSLLLSVNLGGTAIGTAVNADPRYRKQAIKFLREISGYPFRAAPNLIAATQDSFTLCHVSSALKIAAMNLSKMANDIRLMASGPRGGLAEIFIPNLQPGSSIMPGKVNPVILEVTNQVAYQVAGNDLTIDLAAKAGQFELNVMLPVLSHNLYQSIRILANVSRILAEKCILGIKANVKNCREHLDRSTALATEISALIGYEQAAKLAKESIKSGKGFLALLLEKKLVTPKQLDKLVK